jgi:GMP synthase-like glutamine amidotransferase
LNLNRFGDNQPKIVRQVISVNKLSDILIIEHEQDSPAGSTLDWLKAKGLSFQKTSPQTQPFPLLESFKDLIILGGSMNVGETDKHPWLQTEKEFIRKSLAAGKRIVGICLGAQLLAEILGSKVEPMGHWEIGWHSVEFQDGSPKLLAFHWHQQKFELPTGASRMAFSEACANQGFYWKDQVMAFQFHPEADENWVSEALVDYQRPTSPFAQTPQEIREKTKQSLAPARDWYFSKLEQFLMQKNA